MRKYHPVAARIVALLKERHAWCEVFEHAPARTSEESAALRPGYTLHQGAKALIVRARGPAPLKEEKLLMLVCPGDAKFDAKKVKNLLGAKELNFATGAEVAAVTGGVQIGGVPPFGNLFGLQTFADESLFENEKIIFNAGDRSFSVAMKSEDYRTLVEPVVAPFAAP